MNRIQLLVMILRNSLSTKCKTTRDRRLKRGYVLSFFIYNLIAII